MLPNVRFLFGVLSLLAAGALLAQPAAKPFTVDDLVRLKRLTDPRTSPDGRYVVFTLSETDMEANKRRTDLWLLDLDAKDASPRRLTQNPANDSSPRWSADGKSIYFLSTRSGTSQVWRLQLAGGEATQVTDYPRDIGSLAVAPTGNRIAVSMEVFIDCADLKCTKDRADAKEKQKATGRVYDRLFVRHWDTWSDGTRSHLFVADIGADGKASTPVDVSKGLDGDVPSKPFGGDEEYAFTPDGSAIVFSMRVAGREEPWSTNFDLYRAPADGSAAPTNLTAANKAWDTQPVFLANGDMAYLAMERPGFEADRFHVVLRDAKTGAIRPLTLSWDRSVSHLGVTGDGKRLLATTEDVGQEALYVIDVPSGTPHKLVGMGMVSDYSAAKGSVVYALASLGGPADLYSVRVSGGTPRRLTSVNEAVLGQRAMSAYEQFSFKGWNDETVYGYVMKPYGFTAGARYPVAFIVHGGPQASFANAWSYRWNPQVFAGQGYGVVFIDFHGSPGYGQAFTDSISKDWGGKPLEDLQKGLAAALEKYPWLDGSNACALGASYGGFMINWIAGKWSDRFKCLVNHDGVFDQRMMYYATEELWFPEWENGGPYYANPQAYEKFNPADFVTNWRTPMLVIHSEQDFRVPLEQGLGTFTALQRQGIPSRLLTFPDENHWVLKPANSVQWHHAVFDWLASYLKPQERHEPAPSSASSQ
ncbi:MAG TPA: S9 family peptidase [Steroidobacteraceae bacterium]|nr:S9 family peptidase [Steroidobacteraceae bacterium]